MRPTFERAPRKDDLAPHALGCFPTSKQDLLRFARAGRADASVLDTIEGLADRNYVSVNDVLSAMDMVH